MAKFKQYNDCEEVKNYFTFMTVQSAAALWCGIPKNEIDEHLKMCHPLNESSAYGQSIFVHPFIECLEFRCRLIQEAIAANKLKVGRDGSKGMFEEEIGHVAYSRRTINREDFKEWVKKEFPNDMPKTLFDDIERNAHASITKDVFLALKADRDKLKNDVDQLKATVNSEISKKEDLVLENEHLKKIIDNLAIPKNTNLQDANLIIIGAMIESIKTANKKQGKATSGVQQKLIDYIVEAYPNTHGLSESQLKKKFAEANNYLKQIVS